MSQIAIDWAALHCTAQKLQLSIIVYFGHTAPQKYKVDQCLYMGVVGQFVPHQKIGTECSECRRSAHRQCPFQQNLTFKEKNDLSETPMLWFIFAWGLSLARGVVTSLLVYGFLGLFIHTIM